MHVGVWGCRMHSLDSFLSPLISAAFGAFQSFMLWFLALVVFGVGCCVRDKRFVVPQKSRNLVCVPDSSSGFVSPQMRGGALSLRRWLRGRSLYCSKLLTARAKSRYLFLTYLLTLHLLVVLCLSGVL